MNEQKAAEEIKIEWIMKSELNSERKARKDELLKPPFGWEIMAWIEWLPEGMNKLTNN